MPGTILRRHTALSKAAIRSSPPDVVDYVCRQLPIRALAVERPPRHVCSCCPRSRSFWGIHPLQQYKLVFLDRLNVVITVRDFGGPDDTAALAYAKSLCATHTIEVTQAERSVGEVGGMRRGGPLV